MTDIDTSRLRELAEKRYELLDADGDIQGREREAEILTLLDEIDRYRGTLARILGYTRGAVRRLMPEELAELERERRSDD